MDFEAPETPPGAKRPGNRKGVPRPPGAGRKKGTPNRVTASVREATQKRGAAALRELWKLVTTAKDEKVRKAALDTWLAYAYGRPVEHRELTGADGAPLHPVADVSHEDAVMRMMFLCERQRNQAPPAAPEDDRSAIVRAFSEATHAPVIAEAAARNAAAAEPAPGGEDVMYMDETGRPWLLDERNNPVPQTPGSVGPPTSRRASRPAVITRRPH